MGRDSSKGSRKINASKKSLENIRDREIKYNKTKVIRKQNNQYEIHAVLRHLGFMTNDLTSTLITIDAESADRFRIV